MTEKTIHVHMAEVFRVFVVTRRPEWAVLQITSQETGELFRFGLHVDHLDALGKQLQMDAKLLKA